MSTPRTARPETATAEVPPVPLTIEGYSVLHQMLRIRWSQWRNLRPAQKTSIIHEATGVLGKMEKGAAGQ